MKQLNVILSGGGTGGHIFPAIAIANAIKDLAPDTKFLFVGAKDKMEMEKVPRAGYKIKGLWISGLQRKLTLKNLLFPFKVMSSILRSHFIIKSFKPNLVIGTGGFASGPVLYAAARKKIPTLIQEQNSFPGITNKLLSKRVMRICVAYPNMERFFPKSKIRLTGNPVRKEIEQPITAEGSKNTFNLEPNKKTLLVIGGSLGARTINESIANSIVQFSENDIQVIWQTGKHYIDQAKRTISNLQSKSIYVSDFIYNMSEAYRCADIIVSRAGAISISELCIIGKPVILVPSPNVAEDHQTKNAMALVEKNAALLVKDSESKDQLEGIVINLFNNEDEQNKLINNIIQLGHKEAAIKIAKEALSLLNETE